MMRSDHRFRASLFKLHQKPVLTAMVVCWLVFSLTAVVATVELWRAASNCSMPQRSAFPYVVHAAGDIAVRSGALSGVRLLHAV